MDQETKKDLIRLRENLLARIWERSKGNKDFSELVPEFVERTEYLNKNHGTRLQIPPYVQKCLDCLGEEPAEPVKEEPAGPVEELYRITVASDIENEHMDLVIKYLTILGIKKVSNEEVLTGTGTELRRTYIYQGTPREVTLLKRSIIALMDVLRVTNAGVYGAVGT